MVTTTACGGPSVGPNAPDTAWALVSVLVRAVRTVLGTRSWGCYSWGLICDEMVEDGKGEVRNRAHANQRAVAGRGLR